MTDHTSVLDATLSLLLSDYKRSKPMRQACQFCGAKCWGPTTSQPSLAEPGAKYLVCDNCHSWAREDLLEVIIPDPPFPSLPGASLPGASLPGAFSASGGMLPDPFSVAMQKATEFFQTGQDGLAQRDAQRESRRERLVHSLLAANPRTGSNQSSESYCDWIVDLATLLDLLLDVPSAERDSGAFITNPSESA